MQIHGLNKTTLLDYPGRVACTVFTGACNFRCPFCQNADLVLNPMSQPLIPEEEVLRHVDKRKGIITGVCITGGEPTLNDGLADFIHKLKERGLFVKLDSNGYRPEVLKSLVNDGLVDYIAMDIKSSPRRYSEAAGVDVDVNKIRESVEFIMASGTDYEFRTTTVRELHDRETFREIGEFIKGADKYFLQGYVDSERVIHPGFTAYSEAELKGFKELLEGYVKKVWIRGV